VKSWRDPLLRAVQAATFLAAHLIIALILIGAIYIVHVFCFLLATLNYSTGYPFDIFSTQWTYSFLWSSLSLERSMPIMNSVRTYAKGAAEGGQHEG
jgi:hypothetical protein